MPSIHHKRQVARIAATLNPPRQPRKWTKKIEPVEMPAFEIKSFVPLSPQSSLATNEGWEYQEGGFSYSNYPR